MNWQTLAGHLFPDGHAITCADHVLSGTARVDGCDVAVIGTTAHTPIGVEIALAQAGAILATVRNFPQRPIVLLVDTQGQRLRRRDELLGINAYMAHLGKCIALARARGHRIVGLVYDQALSGGFITSGMMADDCHALSDATIRVMALPAMARITRVPLERLTELARANPVFAPGPENYARMGGIASIWPSGEPQQWAARLAAALAGADPVDRRAALGEARGGRLMAADILRRLDAAAP